MKAQTLTRETIKNLGVQERDFPPFAVGDTISVAFRIKEGDKERIQLFQGDVIARHNQGISTTFTVRKIGANNISVERIFPYYSPKIESIKIVRKGKVRRAKLYYVRDRIGKAARIKEQVVSKKDKKAKLDNKNKTVSPPTAL